MPGTAWKNTDGLVQKYGTTDLRPFPTTTGEPNQLEASVRRNQFNDRLFSDYQSLVPWKHLVNNMLPTGGTPATSGIKTSNFNCYLTATTGSWYYLKTVATHSGTFIGALNFRKGTANTAGDYIAFSEPVNDYSGSTLYAGVSTNLFFSRPWSWTGGIRVPSQTATIAQHNVLVGLLATSLIEYTAANSTTLSPSQLVSDGSLTTGATYVGVGLYLNNGTLYAFVQTGTASVSSVVTLTSSAALSTTYIVTIEYDGDRRLQYFLNGTLVANAVINSNVVLSTTGQAVARYCGLELTSTTLGNADIIFNDFSMNEG